eukprot:2109160-Amphidinium_carterae.1
MSGVRLQRLVILGRTCVLSATRLQLQQFACAAPTAAQPTLSRQQGHSGTFETIRTRRNG